MSLTTNVAPILGHARRDGVKCKIGGKRAQQDCQSEGLGGQMRAVQHRRGLSQVVARGNRWAVHTRGRNVSVASQIDTKDRWWEKESAENMIEVTSTNQFVEELATAGNRLVICDFYARWCGACRALYPKLCKLAQEYPDIIILKVEFESNKDLCRSLAVKVLPYFHFYRGAEGRLASFSASLTKFSRLKEAIQTHNTDRCPLGPTLGLGDEEELVLSGTK